MKRDLDGKVVFVTGASRGIGRAIAVEVARMGASLALMDLKKETMGSEPKTSPALAFVLGLAVVATLVLGIYPRLLFEVADASARTLGAGISASVR